MAQVGTSLANLGDNLRAGHFWRPELAELPFFQILLVLLLSVDLTLIGMHILRLNFETFDKAVYSILSSRTGGLH